MFLVNYGDDNIQIWKKVFSMDTYLIQGVAVSDIDGMPEKSLDYVAVYLKKAD